MTLTILRDLTETEVAALTHAARQANLTEITPQAYCETVLESLIANAVRDSRQKQDAANLSILQYASDKTRADVQTLLDAEKAKQDQAKADAVVAKAEAAVNADTIES